MTHPHVIKTELLGTGTATIGAAKAEEGHPRQYRLGRRNGELVLQGAFFWQRGFRESGHEWRDIPIVDLDGEAAMKNTDQDRAEFEREMKAIFTHTDFELAPEGHYKNPVTGTWLLIWQAARRTQVMPQGVVDMCDVCSRKYIKMQDHPQKDGKPRCPHCMADGLNCARHTPAAQVPQWDGVIRPADFIVDTFHRSGSGWVSKPDSCVRITHRPTGLFEEETTMRSVHTNKAIAWQRLSDRLEALTAARGAQPPQHEK